MATPGVPDDDELGGWVGEGVTRGGMTSGLSHLRADMHEVSNAAAAAARIIAEIGSDGTQVRARKDEIVEILSHTAKPYFGDLEEMTYEAWVRRFADLSFPWVDPSGRSATTTCSSASRRAWPPWITARSRPSSRPSRTSLTRTPPPTA